MQEQSQKEDATLWIHQNNGRNRRTSGFEGSGNKPYVAKKKQQRNELCVCGSGKKFKQCCGSNN